MKRAIIFDIDGTLADVEHRRRHLPNWPKFFAEMDKDPCIEPVAYLLKTIAKTDDYIIIVSARPDDYKEVTLKWLLQHKLCFDEIYMRKSGDFRKDSIVKAEILQQIIDDGYEPFLVVDDRPQVVEMWRSFGIVTLQCAPDEIQPKHDGVHCVDIFVGPAGAGKSTYAHTIARPHDIISSDQIREQYGWGHSPEDLNKTWNYVHSLIKARAENHIYTIVDATNIKNADRKKIVGCVPKGQYVRYIVIDRPLDDKLKDRGDRSEELVLKHHQTMRSNIKDILAGDNLPNVVVLDRRIK